jgi:chromosome segregation ATPase
MENLNSFIQILLWIVLPVLTIAVIVTVVLHYWRKRNAAKELPEELLQTGLPTFTNQPASEPPVAKTNLKAENNREIIAHLKSEYSFLEKKYEELKTTRHNTGEGADNHAANEMLRNAEEKIAALNNEIASLKNAEATYLNNKSSHTAELENRVKESEMRLVQLQQEMYNKLNSKHEEFLQLQIEKEKLYNETLELKQQKEAFNKQGGAVQVHTDEEYEKLVKENESLVNKVADYSYFDDLVNEKKQQIAFLENQIEQRVRQVHDTEQHYYAELKKVEMYGAQIAELRTKHDEVTNKLAEQNKLYNTQLLELEAVRNESQKQLHTISEKQHFIKELENNFKLEKESSEQLKQTIEGYKKDVAGLTQQTEDQIRKIEELEGKLKISSQLLARIYTDLGKSFASIFSEEINILPENTKITALNKSTEPVQQHEEDNDESFAEPVMEEQHHHHR